jgi:hypothetical protein
MLADWQSANPIYGRAHNPWDLGRTRGGRSGGSAAAPAAGLTALEVGSDIGGAIRVRAAFCGVYGHRPSETLLPKSGQFPMPPMPNSAVVMGVQGPLARSAEDLELPLSVCWPAPSSVRTSPGVSSYRRCVTRGSRTSAWQCCRRCRGSTLTQQAAALEGVQPLAFSATIIMTVQLDTMAATGSASPRPVFCPPPF